MHLLNGVGVSKHMEKGLEEHERAGTGGGGRAPSTCSELPQLPRQSLGPSGLLAPPPFLTPALSRLGMFPKCLVRSGGWVGCAKWRQEDMSQRT